MAETANLSLRDGFRGGMSRLAGGVCLITAQAPDGGMVGLTVSSAASVSADPPSLLCCINKTSRSHDAIIQSGAFAANVISADDQALAAAFATEKTMDEKFAEGAWLQRATGSPVLQSAAVSFDCRIRDIFEATTHTIVIGEVADIYLPEQSPQGLVYWERQFVTLTRKA
ncbi:MAG: flavin reductase family protein [Caulobacterales bacterium]